MPGVPDDGDLLLLARATLAVHLAAGHSDIGQPEGLAYKIGIFERVARESGWVVD